MKEKIQKILNKSPVIHKIASSISKGIEYLFKILLILIFPIKKNKIVICNYYGKGYGDNGKYIVEEIIRRELDYDIVWLLKKDLFGKCKFPPNIRIVLYNSIRGLYEMATSKIWIDNCRKTFYPIKRKNQYYIQTWHGSVMLKKVEKDAENKLDITYINSCKNDSKMADLFLSNSKFTSNLFKKSFWYDGKIFECGSPRNDILINRPNDIKNKVFRYFGLDDDTKIVLYAPTFRVDSNMEVYNLKFIQILTALKKKHGCNWIFLVRLHPNISQKADAVSYNAQVINATNYDDMQELMVASDILMTDYSSTMFEFMLMQKPVFLYTTDIAEYITDRDLYFDIFSLPFPVAENNDKLLEYISSFNEAQYLNAVASFTNEIVLIDDGRATEKIVEKIETMIGSLI